MNRSEFIAETVTFPLGTVVVVSGADEAAVELLLDEARTAIEGATTKLVLLFNSRDDVVYPRRYFVPESASETITPISESAARLNEFSVVAADGNFVILVANEFDINDPEQNRRPVSLVIDTVIDLFNPNRVKDIPYAFHRRFGVTRELFPYITKIYHFDTAADEIVFIKNQNPSRP